MVYFDLSNWLRRDRARMLRGCCCCESGFLVDAGLASFLTLPGFARRMRTGASGIWWCLRWRWVWSEGWGLAAVVNVAERRRRMDVGFMVP